MDAGHFDFPIQDGVVHHTQQTFVLINREGIHRGDEDLVAPLYTSEGRKRAAGVGHTWTVNLGGQQPVVEHLVTQDEMLLKRERIGRVVECSHLEVGHIGLDELLGFVGGFRDIVVLIQRLIYLVGDIGLHKEVIEADLVLFGSEAGGACNRGALGQRQGVNVGSNLECSAVERIVRTHEDHVLDHFVLEAHTSIVAQSPRHGDGVACTGIGGRHDDFAGHQVGIGCDLDIQGVVEEVVTFVDLMERSGGTGTRQVIIRMT